MNRIESNRIESNRIKSCENQIYVTNSFFFIQILWDNRLLGDIGIPQKITTDGTDFRVMQQPNQRGYYSFKFRGPAMRYELGIGIQSGYIVWASRGYKAGANPDITIFRKGGLKDLLLEAGEKTVADLGYRGEPELIDVPNEGSADYRVQMAYARARHETCNKRLKNFNCLKERFRHSIDYHNVCFDAVLVVTQLSLQNGEPLFDVEFSGEQEVDSDESSEDDESSDDESNDSD